MRTDTNNRTRLRTRRAKLALGTAAAMAAALAVAPVMASSLRPDRLITRFETPDLHLHVVRSVGAAVRFDVRRAEAVEAVARQGRSDGQISSLAAAAPSEVGEWGPPIKMMVSGIHSVQLPTGRVLYFANLANFTEAGHGTDAWTWDPATGDWNHVPPPLGPNGKPANIWCGGQSFLSDGRLVVAGGNARFPIGNREASEGNGYKGLDRVFTFNPFDETWTEQPRMRQGRWYPTLVTLPDDRVVILGGLDETGFENRNIDLEVFTPSASIGGVGSIAHKPTGDRDTQLYPHLKYFPGNRVVLTGPDAGDAGILDTTTWTWSDLPNLPEDRLWGASVIDPYDAATGPTSITMVGGSDGGSAAADGRSFRLNLAGATPTWSSGPTMARGRSHVNAQLLPDGSTFAVGGGRGILAPDGLYAGPVYSAEITNSAGNAWIETPEQVNRRTYHSSSALLPDGRVVSTGDDKDTVKRDMQIYSPPYLFRGPRPTITATAAAATYGERFRLTSGDASTISSVVLMAPTATTHSTDMSQRAIRLTVTPETSGSVLVDAPPNAESVLPGYYMLFALNSAGVPSVATWLRVTDEATPDPGPAAPAPPQPAPAVPAAPPVAPPPVVTTVVPRPAARAFLSARLARPVKGQLWAQARFGTSGLLKVSVETRRGPRVLCRVPVKARAVIRCRLDGRLRGSDRVTLAFTSRGKTVARILRVR